MPSLVDWKLEVCDCQVNFVPEAASNVFIQFAKDISNMFFLAIVGKFFQPWIPMIIKMLKRSRKKTANEF